MNLKKLIRENVKKVLLEMDIVPTDYQGNTNLVTRQSINAWRMLYRLMDNVKVSMNATWNDKNGQIINKDVDDIIDYINISLQNITKNTIGGK